MKIAVTGVKGFLGARVKKVLEQRGHVVFGIDLPEINISDFKALSDALKGFMPDSIVHCAAIGDISICENNNELAYRVNIGGTRNITAVCANLNASVVFISSDQVYNYSSCTPINEYTTTAPLNFYGFTKVEGEKSVSAVVSRHHIARIAWQYSVQEPGLPNSRDGLLEKVIAAYNKKERLTYVPGAFQNINFVYDTVNVLTVMAERSLPYGTYNITSPNVLSELDTLKYILKQLGASDAESAKLLVPDGNAPKFDLRAEPLNLKIAGYEMPHFTEGLHSSLKLVKE